MLPVLRGVGSLIFGGIDTKKFTGPLHRLPIMPHVDGYRRYWVELASLGLTDPHAEDTMALHSLSLPVFLDSGSTLSILPHEYAKAVGDALFGVEKSTLGMTVWEVSCDLLFSKSTIDFGFGDFEISIPLHQFILRTGPEQCVSGISTFGPEMNIWTLGGMKFPKNKRPRLIVYPDTFLRSTYGECLVTMSGYSTDRAVVFDQDHNEIHLAIHADCGQNLIAIGNGDKASVTGDCNIPGPTSTSASALSTPITSKEGSSGAGDGNKSKDKGKDKHKHSGNKKKHE